MTQELTEEDRNLAAALVAVQLSQQQKQQQLQEPPLPPLIGKLFCLKIAKFIVRLVIVSLATLHCHTSTHFDVSHHLLSQNLNFLPIFKVYMHFPLIPKKVTFWQHHTIFTKLI